MEKSITTQIDIKASPEAVFDAWTDPEQIIAWWGEEGSYGHVRCEFDLRVGGKWRSDGVRADGSGFYTEGVYLKVDRPNALSFTWQPSWDGHGSNTTVEIEFLPTETGTLLKLKHSGFPTEEERAMFENGWPTVLGWLRGHAEAQAAVR